MTAQDQKYLDQLEQTFQRMQYLETLKIEVKQAKSLAEFGVVHVKIKQING